MRRNSLDQAEDLDAPEDVLTKSVDTFFFDRRFEFVFENLHFFNYKGKATPHTINIWMGGHRETVFRCKKKYMTALIASLLDGNISNE
jgi:hypothetical protein